MFYEKDFIGFCLQFVRFRDGFGSREKRLSLIHIFSYALEKGKRYSLDEFKTMLLTSVNEIDSRLGEGSKATIADVSIYRGKMGTGITDAYQLLMQIEGTPCLQVALGEVQLIPLTQHFGQGAEDLTYTDTVSYTHLRMAAELRQPRNYVERLEFSVSTERSSCLLYTSTICDQAVKSKSKLP